MAASLFNDLTALYSSREVIRNLVSVDLKLRFRRSILGYGWSLLYPLMTMLLLALVFHKIARAASPQEYVLYVFSGMVPWNFFLACSTACGTSIVNNEPLLKKVYLPKLIFPFSMLVARFIDFLLNLAALFIIVSFIAFKPSLALLSLPLALLLLAAFTAGVSMALAAITVYVRDAVHLTTVMLQICFYATPIIYPESWLDGAWYKVYFELNPVVHFIRLFQAILSRGVFPTSGQWLIATGVALLSFLAGYLIFRALSRNLIFRL
jgi:ABC-type polysaccharide/polyol phosphate export permease